MDLSTSTATRPDRTPLPIRPTPASTEPRSTTDLTVHSVTGRYRDAAHLAGSSRCTPIARGFVAALTAATAARSPCTPHDLAGFSQGYVAQIEKGLTPLDRRTSQEALARALQVSVGELTGRHDESDPYEPVGPDAMATLDQASSRCPARRSPTASSLLSSGHTD